MGRVNPVPLTEQQHQAAVDSLVIARQTAPTEANRLLLAQAILAQTVAFGAKP